MELENFKEFLDNNLKADVYDFQAYCEELELQYANTGMKEYELSSRETKSGLPEIYKY